MPTSKTDQKIIDETVDEKIEVAIEDAQLEPIPSLDTAKNVASRTTAEQDLKSAAQRGINLTWEDTQKKIALYAVYLTMAISAIVVLAGLSGFVNDSVLIIAAFTFMASTTNLIVGFYFSRTNHARIGDDPAVKKRSGLDDR